MPRHPLPSARARLQRGAAAAAALGLATLALAAAQPAQATTITDPTGDILGTFNGPKTGPASGPFDVTSVSAVEDGSAIQISATMAGPATAAGYIVGINRGAGAALLTGGTPSVGAGIVFDAVAVLIPGGGSVVELFPSMTFTPLSEVTFSGNSVTAVIPVGDFPTTGFSLANYGYSFWPRDGLDPTMNAQISDFAPDMSTFTASVVTAVPEPSTWALMLAGVGLLGAALRTRGRIAPSPRSA